MAEVATSLDTTSPMSSGFSSLMASPTETGMISPDVQEALDRIIPSSAKQLFQLPSSPDKSGHNSVGLRRDSTDTQADHHEGSRNSDNTGSHNAHSAKPTAGRKPIGKLRISKADMEIIASSMSPENVDGRKPRNGVMSDVISPEEKSAQEHDSDDMCRPFISQKQKKEKKKSKKLKKDSGKNSLKLVIPSTRDSEHIVDDEFQTNTKRKTRNDSSLNESNLSKRSIVSALEEEYFTEKKSSNQDKDPDLCKENIAETSSDQDNQLSTTEIVNISSKDDSKKPPDFAALDTSIGSEEASNFSVSSSKENPHCPTRCAQKLPKVKKSMYDINAHRKSIRNTFPPCLVVLERIVPNHSVEDNIVCKSSLLPLPMRTEHLQKMCVRGELKNCRARKKKKKKKQEVFDKDHCSILDDSLLAGHSEDEFVLNKREGRSLRKRNQNISYAEPTEFDIFTDSKTGKSRSKKKESSAESNDEETKEKAKKGKVKSKGVDVVADAADKTKTSDTGVETVYVYPKTKTNDSEKAKEKEAHGKDVSPVSSKGVSSTTTLPSFLFPSNTTASFLNSLPSLQPMPAIVSTGQIPIPNALTTGVRVPVRPNKQPQYCMVKMGGKDVLVQLVPSTSPMQAITAPSPGNQAVPRIPLVPSLSCTSLVVPPRIIQQPGIRSTGITSMIGAPLPSGSIFRLARPGSLPNNVPMIPISQFPGYTGAGALSRPTLAAPLSSVIPLTPVTSTSPALVSVPVSSSMAAAVSTVAGSLTSVRPITASTVTSSSTVSLNSAQIRQLRVFVPGCQATGTRGHFTTLSSVQANPLTRLSASSQLLPQRKRSLTDSLSPDQKAAKRRRLEKKYPLPPGVVIKTESLDTPPPAPPKTTGIRSLLRQGCIQVIPGGGIRNRGSVQSIRIISPALAASMNARTQGTSSSTMSNLLFRASSGSGVQTVLVPLSSTARTATTASTSTSNGPKNTVVTSGNVVLVSPPPSATLVCGPIRRPGTCTSSTAGSAITSLATATSSALQQQRAERVPTPMSCSTTDTTSNSPISQSQTSHSDSVVGVTSATKSTSKSATDSAVASSSKSTDVPSSDVSQSSLSPLETIQSNIETLKTLIAAQESRGLTGQRLDKLKSVLKEREEALATLISQVVEDQGAGVSVSESSNENTREAPSGCDLAHDGSEVDPFIIE